MTPFPSDTPVKTHIKHFYVYDPIVVDIIIVQNSTFKEMASNVYIYSLIVFKSELEQNLPAPVFYGYCQM